MSADKPTASSEVNGSDAADLAQVRVLFSAAMI